MSVIPIFETLRQNLPGRRRASHFLRTILTLPLAAFSLGSMAATPAPHWDWTQNTVFVETHDPMMIVLEGEVALEVLYDTVPYDEVDKWPKGKPLQVAYSKKTGAVLVDPVSGKWLPVIDGLKQHPIDAIVEQCMTAPDATDIRSCFDKASELWDADLNLWFGRLMASKSPDLLDDAGKQQLRRAQQQWLQFRNAQVKVIAAIYYHRDGTIWAQIAQQKIAALTKAQALHLASLMQFF